MSLLTVPQVVRRSVSEQTQTLAASTTKDQFCSCLTLTRVKFFLVWASIFSGRLCWCLRTYALWNRPRWLIVLGVPALILESLSILTGTMRIRHVPVMTGLQQVCMSSPATRSWSIMAWIVPFIIDTTLSLLSIVRAMRVSRKLKTPLTTQLIRDGTENVSSSP